MFRRRVPAHHVAESLHSRCPGGCCRGSCPGSVIRFATRWVVPLALAGCCAIFAFAQTTRTAVVWVGLQVTLEGELTRTPVLNTSFWSSVSDGLEDGFWLSQGVIAVFSGVWPYLCVLAFWLLWFVPRPVGSWITVAVLCTKWNIWYLVFAFLQALAFSYRIVITTFPGGAFEFFTFVDVDIQASDGAYLIAFGSIAIQTLGNSAYIANMWLGNDEHETHVAADKWSQPRSNNQTCYPLFLTLFWRTSRSAEYNCDCPRATAVVWAAFCQLVVAALLIVGVSLSTKALVDDLFTTRQQTGIDLEIAIREPNNTEALLPLTFAVANGILAGPGVELERYEELGQLVLSSIFFGVFVIAPLLLFFFLAIIWTAPLSSRWRKAVLNAAILCHSWNCHDIFALALIIAEFDIFDLTGALADDACADLADALPGFIVEGEYCLSTSLELRSGAYVLVAAAVLQWLALGVIYMLVQVDQTEKLYYPLPQSNSDQAATSWFSGADKISTARDNIDASHSGGAVWAHDAPDERSGFARTDQPRDGDVRSRYTYGSTLSTRRDGTRRLRRSSVNEVVRGEDRDGCTLQ